MDGDYIDFEVISNRFHILKKKGYHVMKCDQGNNFKVQVTVNCRFDHWTGIEATNFPEAVNMAMGYVIAKGIL